MKQFKLEDTRDGAQVMGPLGGDNAYLTMYGSPVNAGDKAPSDLDVGESVLRRYTLSGTSGVYRLVRLADV